MHVSFSSRRTFGNATPHRLRFRCLPTVQAARSARRLNSLMRRSARERNRRRIMVHVEEAARCCPVARRCNVARICCCVLEAYVLEPVPKTRPIASRMSNICKPRRRCTRMGKDGSCFVRSGPLDLRFCGLVRHPASVLLRSRTKLNGMTVCNTSFAHHPGGTCVRMTPMAARGTRPHAGGLPSDADID